MWYGCVPAVPVVLLQRSALLQTHLGRGLLLLLLRLCCCCLILVAVVVLLKTVLTVGRSRLVCAVLAEAARQQKRFQVYVTQSAPLNTGFVT